MPDVVGIFEDCSQAKQAIERMTKNHIGLDRIAMIALDADADGMEKKAGSFGTGAGIGAAASGLHDSLAALGIPEDESRSYEEQIRGGHVLVTVRAAEGAEAEQAANLMEVQGAVEVEGAGERGNVEAAPGYQGARAEEEGDLLKNPMSSAPGRRIPPNPKRRSDFRSPGGRIRIFGGA